MSLRMKLAVALIFSALLPMGVAVGLPMLQAERRAQEEAARRLRSVRHQAAVLIERQKADAASRLKQAAAELAGRRPSRQPLWQGPAAAARTITRSLADRYGLDYLEIRNAQGALLATSEGEAGERPPLSLTDLEEGEVVLRRFRTALPDAAPEAVSDDPAVGFFARTMVMLGNDTLSLAGGRAVGREFLAGISEISGEPSDLVDAAGAVMQATGGASIAGEMSPPRRLASEVPIGDGGFKVRVSVPAGDARLVRRELLAAFAGVAPFAIASALLVGMLLAEGISRPIRGVAARVEAISAARAGGPLSLVPGRDEVRRLTTSFDRMLEALSQSGRQRGAAEQIAAWQEVARRIAHEVKNPLSPIKIAVENLRRTRDRAPEEFERSFQEETATILEEVESLRRLVDEFSQFARLPAAQPVPCDLRQSVSQALGLLAPRIAALGVAVAVLDDGVPVSVRADPEQIGRVLRNVLANALDALEPASERRLEVRLSAALGRRGGSAAPFAEIEVRDSGAGFTPDALRRVFEPYYTTRADRGGTGLGMAIAYRIVTEHGGAIQAGGAPGGGALVTVRLPVGGPAEA